MPKIIKVTNFRGFWKASLSQYIKKLKGRTGDIEKYSKKVSQCRNKNEKGPFSLGSRARTRHSRVSPKPINVCTKKWYIQCEVCGRLKTPYFFRFLQSVVLETDSFVKFEINITRMRSRLLLRLFETSFANFEFSFTWFPKTLFCSSRKELNFDESHTKNDTNI